MAVSDLKAELLAGAVDRSQELPDPPKLEGEGENFELAATERAEHRIDLEHLANELSPRDSATLLPALEIFILARLGDGFLRALRALGSFTEALASRGVRIESPVTLNLLPTIRYVLRHSCNEIEHVPASK